MNAQGTEVFDVTCFQLRRWEHENYLNFSLELQEGVPYLLVSASIDRGGWWICAQSDPDALDRVEELNEWGLENAANGCKNNLAFEVWHIVDMPANDTTYQVDSDSLLEIVRAAEELEEVVMSSTGHWDVQDYLDEDGHVVPYRLDSGQCSVMEQAVRLRRLVSNISRG